MLEDKLVLVVLVEQGKEAQVVQVVQEVDLNLTEIQVIKAELVTLVQANMVVVA